MKQSLSQKLQQKLTPQQILLMKLIELPTTELEARLKKEIEENPVIEDAGLGKESELSPDKADADDQWSDEETDFYHSDEEEVRTTARETVPEDRQFFSLSQRYSLQDELMDQIALKLQSETELIIARYLIGSLDDSGYLRRDNSSIVDDLAFTQFVECSEEEVEEVVKKLQELDPAGVGARDLRESLLLQMKRKDQSDLITKNAIYILENLFDDFSHNRYEKIVERTGISESDLKRVIEEIKTLNPKPGEPQASLNQQKISVTPDFIVSVSNDDIKINLNSGSVPELNINKAYLEMLNEDENQKGLDKSKRETIRFIKSKVESARWFITALRQRDETLMKTMEAIAVRQRTYFLSGDDRAIKPMILKDIADVIEMDISTVSRVVNSKYVQCPYGVFPLKKFFSEGFLKEGGEEVSTLQVKGVLKDIITGEDDANPLKDEDLVEILKEKGYPIARRTVAKYREQLGIPVARLRRKL